MGYTQNVIEEMKELHYKLIESFGYVPQIFILHRGNHPQDNEWYKEFSDQFLQQIEYEDRNVDQWLKPLSHKWKCNKPGKSYLVNGSALAAEVEKF